MGLWRPRRGSAAPGLLQLGGESAPGGGLPHHGPKALPDPLHVGPVQLRTAFPYEGLYLLQLTGV